MKITLTLLLNLLTIVSISQNLTNVSGPIEVIGITLNVGDKLIVYEPQNFQKTYESIYTNQKLTTKRSRITEIDDKAYDFSLVEYTIKKIKKSSDGRIVLSDGGLFPNFIDIKAALENGEVITKEELSNRHKERDLLNDSTAFVHFIKRFNGETNEFWKDFVYTYQYELYKRTHEDEFEFYGVVNKAGEFLLEAAERLDNSTIYSASVEVELDDYDFSTNSFNFIWKGNHFKIFRSSSWCKCALDEINLELSNLEKFRSISVPFEQAKAFIANRKNKYGKVDRDVYLWVNLKLTDDLKFENKNALIRGIVQSIEVFADENLINGYLGTIPK